jgi:hypothetical protein
VKFRVRDCVKCGTSLEGPGERGGRPSRFCSEGCKTSTEAEMRRLTVVLRKFEVERGHCLIHGGTPERTDRVIAELQARFDHLAGVPQP